MTSGEDTRDKKHGEHRLSRVLVIYGQLRASVVKSRLEFNGIPVVLRYESAGDVFGITVDGLGKIEVMVPEELAAEAKAILNSIPEEDATSGSGTDDGQGQ